MFVHPGIVIAVYNDLKTVKNLCTGLHVHVSVWTCCRRCCNSQLSFTYFTALVIELLISSSVLYTVSYWDSIENCYALTSMTSSHTYWPLNSPSWTAYNAPTARTVHHSYHSYQWHHCHISAVIISRISVIFIFVYSVHEDQHQLRQQVL